MTFMMVSHYMSTLFSTYTINPFAGVGNETPPPLPHTQLCQKVGLL